MLRCRLERVTTCPHPTARRPRAPAEPAVSPAPKPTPSTDRRTTRRGARRRTRVPARDTRRTHHGPSSARSPDERHVVRQHAPLQLLHRRSRIDPEVLRQDVPTALERLERILLAPRAIRRLGKQQPATFPKRFILDKAGGRLDCLREPTQPQHCLHEQFVRLGVQLVQACRLDHGLGDDRQVLVGISAGPPTKGVAQDECGAVPLADLDQFAASPEALLENVGVHGDRVATEAVPIRRGPDGLRTQVAAQPVDAAVDHLRR